MPGTTPDAVSITVKAPLTVSTLGGRFLFSAENRITYCSENLASALLPDPQGHVRMLKISLVDGPRERRLIVEGTLVTPWASELASTCEKARDDLEGRELIVDLRSLTRISSEGERVLLQLIKNKTKLQCGVFVRELLRQLVRSTQLNATDAGDALNGADSEG